MGMLKYKKKKKENECVRSTLSYSYDEHRPPALHVHNTSKGSYPRVLTPREHRTHVRNNTLPARRLSETSCRNYIHFYARFQTESCF